jgi:hypothetical protein
MTNGDQPIRVEFVKEFPNGEPAMLILGSAQGFLSLASIFESRWSGDLSVFPWVKLKDINLKLSYSDAARQLERNELQFHWLLSDAEVRAFPSQLKALCGQRPSRPCVFRHPRTKWRHSGGRIYRRI